MSWFSLFLNLVTLLTAITKWAERNTIMNEVTQVERARQLARLNELIYQASQVPTFTNKSEKELNDYVQERGWFRD